MRHYDKSLIEVWDWKEKVYREVKYLTAEEYVEKIRKEAESSLLDSHIQLTPVVLKDKHHKVA